MHTVDDFEMRTCPCCNQTMYAMHFHKRGSKRDRRDTICGTCRSRGEDKKMTWAPSDSVLLSSHYLMRMGERKSVVPPLHVLAYMMYCAKDYPNEKCRIEYEDTDYVFKAYELDKHPGSWKLILVTCAPAGRARSRGVNVTRAMTWDMGKIESGRIKRVNR